MNLKKALSALLGRLLCIGFSVQILLGLAWMVANFSGLQLFGETAYLVRVSGTLLADEYTGILYPALLLLVRFLTTVGPIRWYWVMYVIQLLFAFGTGYAFLRNLGFMKSSGPWCIWGSLVMMTFPMMMQVHLAILPESFTFGLLLLEWTAAVRSFRMIRMVPRGNLKAAAAATLVAEVCLFWLLLTLNEPEYFWVGLVPVAILVFVILYKIPETLKRHAVYPLIIAVGYFVLIRGALNLTQEKGYYNRPERSWETMLFDRTAWSTILRYKWRIPGELTELLGEDRMSEVSLYPDNVKLVLEPELENLLGTNEAQKLYLELSKRAWDQDKETILRHLAQDLAANTLAPTVTIALLEGYGGGSLAARNYDVMMRAAPRLTGWYMDYSLWFFTAALVICAILAVAAKRADWKEPRLRTPIGFRLSMFFTAVYILLWETMQGDCLQDYKQVIFVTQLWIIWMLSLLPREGLSVEKTS